MKDILWLQYCWMLDGRIWKEINDLIPFSWTKSWCLFILPLLIVWYVQKLHLYICTPEWKSLLCLLRQWGFIDLLQSWQITFSLVWWIFSLCLHKVPSVAAWKSHFAHGYFWWKYIEFVCCCKLPFVVNEYSQKLQLNLIRSWSDFLWLKTLLLFLMLLLHIMLSS